MGKRLLEFNDELIEVREIKQISKSSRWDKKKNEMFFTIEFNTKIPESKIPIPTYIFDYSSDTFRDEQWELLKICLEGIDDLEIIYVT